MHKLDAIKEDEKMENFSSSSLRLFQFSPIKIRRNGERTVEGDEHGTEGRDKSTRSAAI
jgi:hypothetical protein